MVRKTVLDNISNLPSDVMVQILSHLTLKEAVRTSVLSSKWRYQSSMLPNLVFDSNCVSTTENRTTFVKIVDHVLLGHIGPIHKLTLSYRDDQLATSDLDRWILHLSRNSVKELILNIWKGPRYKLTSCFFSCQDMNHLALYRCLLKPPSTFKGFWSLKRLDIQHVTIAQDVFEGLIVCCPVLEKLILVDCDGFTHLKINAPNLQILYVSGDFEAVSLENAVNLVDVIVSLDAITDQALVHGSSSNLVKFFDHLPHVIRLTVEFDFLKYLAVGDLPGKLPKPCLYLNFLSIDILFSSVEVIFTALCLLRSSPALQELRIRAIQAVDRADVEELNSWLYHDNYNCSLTQLRIVHITGIFGVKAELDLIRYLLLNSPVLEIFTVKPASVDGSWDLVKKLLRFGRVSVHSEMIFLDP